MKKIAKTGLLLLLILLLMPHQAFAVETKDLDPEKYFLYDSGFFYGFKSKELAKEYLEKTDGTLYIPSKIGDESFHVIRLTYQDIKLEEANLEPIDWSLLKKVVVDGSPELIRFHFNEKNAYLEKLEFKDNSTSSTRLWVDAITSMFLKGFEVPNSYRQVIHMSGPIYYYNREKAKEFNIDERSPVIAEWSRVIDKERDFEDIKDKRFVQGVIKEGGYLLNPVRITLKHLDAEGEVIKEELSFVGKKLYTCDIEEDGFFGTHIKYNLNTSPDVEYLKTYNAFQLDYEDKESVTNKNEELKGVLKPRLKSRNVNVAPLNYFMLNISEPETFTPPEIEGYTLKSQPATVDFSKTDEFTYNPEEYVFEKEIVFTYEKLKDDYKVSFNLSEGAEEGQTFDAIQVKEGEKAIKPSTPKAKEGYSFKGWYLGDKEYNFEDPVKADLELVAKFEKKPVEKPVEKVTVHFTVDGVVALSKEVEKGKTVGKPSDPEKKEGHIFKGWKHNNSLWDFTQPVTENMTLVASFEADPASQAKVDKSSLQDLYGKVKDEKRKEYTPETWEVFAKALAKAELILNSDLASQDQVKASRDELFDAHLKLRYAKEKAPVAIKEIEKLEDLTVKTGTKEKEIKDKLPKTIKVTDTENKIYNLPLTWKLYNFKEGKAGIFNAKASFTLPKEISEKQVGKEVFINIKVEGKAEDKKFAPENFLSFEKIEDIQIYTGQELVLPKTVKELYKDKLSRRVDVKWDTSNLDRNKAGKYVIKGRVEGRKEKPSLVVHVLERKGQSIKIRDVWGHWGEKAMVWTLENNIFKGNDKYLFEPNRNITRGEFATVLFRLAGANGNHFGGSKFNDIDLDAYYARPVEWARQMNIVKGYPDGNFKPNNPITREEQAAMMNRFINIQGMKFDGRVAENFKDQDKISPWALQDVKQLQVYGAVKGRTDGKFDPQANITRAEVAQILYNLYSNRLEQIKPITENKTPGQGQVNKPGDTNGTKPNPQNPNSPVPENSNTPIPQNPGQGETGNQTIPNQQAKVTVSIDMRTAADNMDLVVPEKKHLVPSDGWILRPTEVTIEEGESSWEVFKRVTSQYNIPISYEFTQQYNSVYIQSINGMGEFDAGQNSGWMYNINGHYPDKGASLTKLRNGDRMEWRYTVNKGDGVGDHLSEY